MLEPTSIDGIIYMLLPEDEKIAAEVTKTYRDGWSRGNDAPYFFVDFNRPEWILEQAKKMHSALRKGELPDILWYIGLDEETQQVATSGAFMFDKPNHRVEKGRGVTKYEFRRHGFFGQLSRFMMKDLANLDVVVEADTNTMHKATQGNCEENLAMPLVGFMPLKYKIPSAEFWRDRDDSDLIFWGDGRVSVCHNVSIDEYAKTPRNPFSVVDRRISPLRDIVTNRLGLESKKGYIESPHELALSKQRIEVTLDNYHTFTYADPSVCGWMKVHSKDIHNLDTDSLVRTARQLHPNIMYVEVDVPATAYAAITQFRLLESGFVPVSYMPGYFYMEDPRYDRKGLPVRVDGVKFAYVTDKNLMRDYLSTMGDRQLRRILIGEAMDVATYVMDIARQQHERELLKGK